MRLLVSTPFARVLDVDIEKIHAPTQRGDWCLLPRHADLVMEIVPGILTHHANGEQAAIALNTGLLVKAGDEVLIASDQAVISDCLADLTHAVQEQFLRQSEDEKRAQTALAHIETGLIRNLIDLEQANVI